MLAEGAGETMPQEGCGMALHAKEALSDGGSLTDTIMKYAERASLAKSKVSELESRLIVLKMGSNTKQTPAWLHATTADAGGIIHPSATRISSANATNYHSLPAPIPTGVSTATEWWDPRVQRRKKERTEGA